MTKTLTVLAAAALLALAAPAAVPGDKHPLNVVVSFSILEDLVRNVGGPDVSVVTLVGRDADAHSFALSPGDMRALDGADLVLVNGLDFEPWLDRVTETISHPERIARLAKGAETHDEMHGHEEEHGHDDEHGHGDEHGHSDEEPAAHPEDGGHGHHHGDVDPHVWQSVPGAMRIVLGIADALCDADPGNCGRHKRRAEIYLASLEKLDRHIREQVGSLPAGKRRVVVPHDAFGHFAEEYGIEFVAAAGLSTHAEPSAKRIAEIVEQVRGLGAQALFLENVSDTRIIRQISRETGMGVGGRLYSDALSHAHGPAATYEAMMRHNTGTLVDALKASASLN